MFFPMCNPMSYDRRAAREHREQKLQFLRWVKDSMETRLAAVNAAIENIESQQRRDDESAS